MGIPGVSLQDVHHRPQQPNAARANGSRVDSDSCWSQEAPAQEGAKKRTRGILRHDNSFAKRHRRLPDPVSSWDILVHPFAGIDVQPFGSTRE